MSIVKSFVYNEPIIKRAAPDNHELLAGGGIEQFEFI